MSVLGRILHLSEYNNWTLSEETSGRLVIQHFQDRSIPPRHLNETKASIFLKFPVEVELVPDCQWQIKLLEISPQARDRPHTEYYA